MRKKGKHMRRFLTLTAAAALALSATSAFADSLADTVMARASSEATVGMHLSLGGKAHVAAKPVYGASLGVRTGGETVSQALATPTAKLAEFNFSGGKVQDARVGTVSFTDAGAVGLDGKRLGFKMDSIPSWTGLAIMGALGLFIVMDDHQNDVDWHGNIAQERAAGAH